jgi:AcrR family transcriptional regulator
MAIGQPPKQKRSRERVQKILLAAADALATASSAEDMTTTDVAHRSGVPVSTIYRYFADRSAIIAALIDKETAEIDAVVVDRLAELNEYTMESLLRTIMNAHLEHFQTQRRSVLLWFGARQSKAVSERVNRRYDYLGQWIFNGGRNAGFVTQETPAWGGDAIIWLCDRSFEFIFRAERPPAEQLAIMEEIYGMLLHVMNRFAPEGGAPEITREQFVVSFGAYRPPTGDDFA